MLHGGFQLSGSSFSSLAPPSAMSFTTFFFFFLPWPETWPSHWGWEGCDLIFLKQLALGVSWFGSALSHGLVVAQTKAFFFHTAKEGGEVLGLGRESQMRRGSHLLVARLIYSWELLLFIFFLILARAAAPLAASSLCRRSMGGASFGPPHRNYPRFGVVCFLNGSLTGSG